MLKPNRRKPRGQTGPIRFGGGKIERKFVDFPNSKDEIEMLIAQAFCACNSSMAPQIARYLSFENLTQLNENNIDFSVQTHFGLRWLELAEFAPLQYFSGKYENIPKIWNTETMLAYLLELILKKNSNKYGKHVILVIYKTHEACFIPPPVMQLVRSKLKDIALSIVLESIYYLSPHNEKDASVWEIWPGNDHGSDWTLGPTVQVEFLKD